MKNPNEVTIKEFQNWLDGVVEFQDEGWTPNPEQWEKILDKIDRLVDTVPTQHQQQHTVPLQRNLHPQQMVPPPQQPAPPRQIVDDVIPPGLSPEEAYLRQQEIDAAQSPDGEGYVSSFK